MKCVTPVLAAVLLCSIPFSANAQSMGQWRAAMNSARWTGPMLASNAETLPKGHVYTEPYFFDVISDGDHHPGSSGFYQYGLTDSFTVGFQPNFAFDTDRANRGMAIGDLKLLSQVRLTHFTPEHQIPTVSLVLNATLPVGKHDHLGASKKGHGSGSFAPEVGVNVQQYFLLKNGHLLRGRINVLKSSPLRTDVAGRSVYGTGLGFRGHARPGSRTSIVAAAEYSLTNEWVLALDVEADFWGRTRVAGHEASEEPAVKQSFPKSWSVGFAPAVEYNWSPSTGILVGVWIVPKGHNSASSVTPAIAISRFW